MNRSKRLTALAVVLLSASMLSAQSANLETAVFAGGCFWGVEGVFEHINGVHDAVSGYAGGEANRAYYRAVSAGITGHAESVQVTFDPDIVSFTELLEVFFTVAHNPTQLNYQGPDHGTQYRSAIFYSGSSQLREARQAIREIEARELYRGEIVTELNRLDEFYPAEDYHQDFMQKNPGHPYVMRWDWPKISHLEAAYPEHYVDQFGQ